VTEEDGRNTVFYKGMYVVMPSYPWWERKNYNSGKKLPEGFVYTSDNNDQWLTEEDLRRIIHGSSFLEEDPGSRLLSTVHRLNERIILNMLNSEEHIPDIDPPLSFGQTTIHSGQP
jgi:hypothetical protein